MTAVPAGGKTLSVRIGGRRISATLAGYIARTFMIWFGIMAFSVSSIIVLASGLDTLNNLAGRVEVSFFSSVYFAFLKLPFLFQETLPFLALFASLGTFWRLVRSHELVTMRAVGVSVWQFLTPVIGCALLIGVVGTAVLNPIAAETYKLFKDQERQLLRQQESAMQVSSSGLWIRQPDLTKDSEEALYIIHAQNADPRQSNIQNVIIFRYDEEARFVERFDAESAVLKDGAWTLKDVWISGPGKRAEKSASVAIPSDLDFGKIEESFAAAETVSFWGLPAFIKVLERAGFSATEHRLQFHKLLSLPLLLAAMCLLAATTSLRPHRRGRVGLLLLTGMITGFVVYIFSNVIFALGLSGKIPIVLAAWTPAGVTVMFGAALLLHLEDG
ncbi:LPS export ABC transporter permease LptG [Limibacillus halophilus]